jgi:5-methylcytosine-specific restriction protein A
VSGVKSPPPGKKKFQEELQRVLKEAQLRGSSDVVVKSGDLHRLAGGYPGRDHNMPSCCDAMIEMKRPTDEIVHAPPKGKGATLTIKYGLPR